MRMLVIGDFHGKFPKKFEKIARDDQIDLIVSVGDFCGSKEYGRLFFKYAYDNDKELWEYIGKRLFNKLEKEIFEVGVAVLRKLNSFGKPVIVVRGNWDPQNWREVGYPREKERYTKRFEEVIKKMKNVKLFLTETYRGWVSKEVGMEIVEFFKDKNINTLYFSGQTADLHKYGQCLDGIVRLLDIILPKSVEFILNANLILSENGFYDNVEKEEYLSESYETDRKIIIRKQF
jgi:predicted phosphodiesterase